jgi:hypothetical protein
MLPIVLVFASLAPPVRIEGASVCPTPQAVQQRLAELLPSATSAPAQTIARVDAAPGGVRVALRRLDGAALGERLFPGGPSCSELAVQAALSIAVWQGRDHPELGLSLPAPEPPRPAATVPPARPGRSAFDLGAGVLASSSGSWVPGLAGAASWTPSGRGAGISAFGFWESRRSAPLAGGGVRWSRGGAGAGGHYRTRLSPWLLLEGRAGLALAISRLEGSGFAVNRRRAGVSPGAAAGVRLMLARPDRPAWVAAWLEALAMSWLWREQARAEPAGAERALPRSALLVSLGASLGRFR